MGLDLPGARNGDRAKRRRRRQDQRRSGGGDEPQSAAGGSSDDAERPSEPAGTCPSSASTGPKGHDQTRTGSQTPKTPRAGGTNPTSGVAGKAARQLSPLSTAANARKGLDAATSGDLGTAGKQAAVMGAKAVAGKASALIAAKIGLPVAAVLVIVLVLAMVFVPIVHQVRLFAYENRQAVAAVDYVSGAWGAVTGDSDTSSQALTQAGDREGPGGLDGLPEGVPGDLVSTHLQIGAALDLPWWVLAAIGEATTGHGVDVGDDHSRESRSELFPAMVPPVEVTDDDSTWVGPYLIDSESVDDPDRLQRHDSSLRQIAAWLQTLLRDTSSYHPDRAFIHDDQKDAWVEAIAGLPLQPLAHEHDSQQLAEEIYQLAYDWYHLGNACPPHERQRGPVEIGDGDLEGLPDHEPIEVGDEFSIYGGALTEEHLENAEIIVGVGQDHDLPPRAWAIALATAIIESQLVNVPGGDRDSLGLFQQRPGTGWGDPEDIMDPVKSSEAFYGVADHLPGGGNKGLLQIENTSCPTCEPPNPHPVGTPWEEWDPGHAAQAVQISGHPTRYDQNMAMAVGVLKTVLDGEIPIEFDDDCPEEDDEDDRRPGVEWACPIDTAVTSPYGPRGGRMHHGTDFGGQEGVTPIVSTKDGTVHAATEYGGYGQTVVIDHGDDTSSLYAHMPVGGMEVSRGDEVHQGEQIGVVGNTGRSTGPHLHFEIREGIGVESGDPVDPQPLLGLPAGSAAVGMECPERDDEPLPPPDWGGQTESDPSGTGGLVVPQLAHLYHETDVFFPGVHEVFGTFCYAPRPPGSPQGHPEGRACDVMLAPLGEMASGDARTLGDEAAQWYVDHADTLGVDQVIWWGEIWTDRRRSEGWRPYSTPCSANVTLGHCDHIHVEVPRGDRPPRIPDP